MPVMLRRILIIASYLGVGFAIVVTTILLVAYGQGYSYDLRTHHFNLNGLLILSSVPGGASISLNGKLNSHKTPYRTYTTAQSYEVVISKSGYFTWRKTVNVRPPEVTNLADIFLVPSDLKTETIDTADSVSALAASRDR